MERNVFYNAQCTNVGIVEVGDWGTGAVASSAARYEVIGLRDRAQGTKYGALRWESIPL